MLVDDIAGFTGFSDFFGTQLLQTIIRFVFRFALESLVNTIQAFAWPGTAVQFYPPWGLIVMIALFIIFPRFLKAPLERWIFDDDDRAGKTG